MQHRVGSLALLVCLCGAPNRLTTATTTNLNHALADAVLDGAARVEELALGQHLALPGVGVGGEMQAHVRIKKAKIEIRSTFGKATAKERVADSAREVATAGCFHHIARFHIEPTDLDPLGLRDLVDADQGCLADVVQDGAEDLGLGQVLLVRVRGRLRRPRVPA